MASSINFVSSFMKLLPILLSFWTLGVHAQSQPDSSIAVPIDNISNKTFRVKASGQQKHIDYDEICGIKLSELHPSYYQKDWKTKSFEIFYRLEDHTLFKYALSQEMVPCYETMRSVVGITIHKVQAIDENGEIKKLAGIFIKFIDDPKKQGR